MSAEKIQELENRTTRLETILEGVLQAVEKQTNSTEKLTNSVTQMTAKLSVVIDDDKETKKRVANVESLTNQNNTQIQILITRLKWQVWAGTALTALLIGAIGKLIFVS